MTNELIRTIHASPLQMVIAVTGGGSLALSDLLTEPGASRSVLEALVPYGGAALCDFLSHKPVQFCSETTARRMAMAAFVRAMRHSPRTSRSERIGVGCCCSLASDRPKRGEHRAHWAVQSDSQTLAASVVFEKGARTRLEEERLVADLLLETVAAQADRVDSPDAATRHDLAERLQRLASPDETVSLRIATAPEMLRDVLFGDRPACRVLPGDWPQVAPDDQIELPRFLFPGSFDPMHRGHRGMVEIVREKFGPDVRIALEIAVHNVDKPPIDFLDLNDRIASVAATPGMADVPLWLTRLPRFADKSDFFHGVTFIVGADTLQRIALPQYYHDAIASTDAAIDRLLANRCRFLCFARGSAGGEPETVETPGLPENLRRIVDFVPASEFRDDISSTRLREETRKTIESRSGESDCQRD